MNIKKFKNILYSLCLPRKGKSGALKPRVAQRYTSNVDGLYKVLDRDRFYARHYTGTKNPMRLIDISTTGCAFKTSLLITKSSYIEVELDRLSKNDIFDNPLLIACEAVYCLPLKDATNRIGAKILEITNQDLEKIKNFIEKTARN